MVFERSYCIWDISQAATLNHTGGLLLNNQTTTNSTGQVSKPVVNQQANVVSMDQQQIALAAVSVTQGLPVASHTSLPAQPQRPSAMATAAPVKKTTPPPPVTINPPTPSVSGPTPPPSVPPIEPAIMTQVTPLSVTESPQQHHQHHQQQHQPPTNVCGFASNVNSMAGANDGLSMSQQVNDLLQPYSQPLGNYQSL